MLRSDIFPWKYISIVLPKKILAQFLVRSQLHLLSLLVLSLGEFFIAFALYQSNVIGTSTLVHMLVSLTMPLASVMAAGCEHVLRVSASSKSYEHKQKATYMYVLHHFCNGLKLQNRFFGSHKTSNTQIWILWPLWLHVDTADL
jgi:hypothetical protein